MRLVDIQLGAVQVRLVSLRLQDVVPAVECQFLSSCGGGKMTIDLLFLSSCGSRALLIRPPASLKGTWFSSRNLSRGGGAEKGKEGTIARPWVPLIQFQITPASETTLQTAEYRT
jgi:hypothetical protein